MIMNIEERSIRKVRHVAMGPLCVSENVGPSTSLRSRTISLMVCVSDTVLMKAIFVKGVWTEGLMKEEGERKNGK